MGSSHELTIPSSLVIISARTGGAVDYAALAFRFLLGFVFLFASLPKLAAPRDFARAVANYQLLPHALARHVARWLPALELAAAACLLVGIAIPIVAAMASALLLAFAAAVTINLLRGRAIECGCGGLAAPKKIGPGLVVHDVVLAAAAAALASSASDARAAPRLSLGAPSSLQANAALAVLIAAAVAVSIATATSAARRAGEAGRAFTRRLET
jgi:uncharacterized membrane protein YphA (DoxX/SURF4 family)